MATGLVLSALPSTDRRKSQEATNEQGRTASPNGDGWVKHSLQNRNTPSQEEALKKRIASLPPLRQNKVLDIRRQIADGTYGVSDRLDISIDRLLESLTADRYLTER